MKFIFASLLLTANWVLAKPLPKAEGKVHLIERQTQQNPCAEVADILASNSTGGNLVPAALAYACLNDVPLDVNGSVTLLQALRPFLESHTTLAYLKNPPDSYLLPSVDIMGQLDNITSGISGGMFPNQYTLELAVTNLLAQGHDTHLAYFMNLAAGIFGFARVSLALTSISVNGSTPLPYVYADIVALSRGETFEPSAVVSINGMDAIEYLEDFSMRGNLQDPDALYNQLFYNLASAITPLDLATSPGYFAGAAGYIYLGENTTLAFANGTHLVHANMAFTTKTFENVTSGVDVFNLYVNPPQTSTAVETASATATSALETSTAAETSAAATSTATPTEYPRPGYPEPVITFPDNRVAGYYLRADAYSSVAVLSLPTFDASNGVEGNATLFQSVIYEFLANASTVDNKTHLIIDVTGNGGGDVYQGYNLFLNLFPDLFPSQLNRRRATPILDAIGTLVSKYDVQYPFINESDPAVDAELSTSLSNFNYREDEDINNQSFTSWPEKFGPHTFNGDNFTSLFQLNLSDPNIALIYGIDVNSFGDRVGIPPARPFPNPENIILLTDGACGSTCSIFADLMTEVAGVKTVVAGGRPMNGPMAAIGGTRGTNRWTFDVLFVVANGTYSFVEEEGNGNETDLALIEESGVGALLEGYELVSSRASAGAVNSRDLIRKVDVESGVPAQFTYEAADCRIWYTAESVVDVRALWRDVADVAWGNGQCVNGTIGYDRQ